MKRPQEALLAYRPDTGQWRRTNVWFPVWVDDPMLSASVASWYAWTRWLLDLSPEGRYAAALAHCRRVNSWFGYERNDAQRVHISDR